MYFHFKCMLTSFAHFNIGLDKQNFERKIVNIF